MILRIEGGSLVESAVAAEAVWMGNSMFTLFRSMSLRSQSFNGNLNLSMRVRNVFEYGNLLVSCIRDVQSS
jgi:flagellar basal body L-ring protein FlgH